MVVTLTLQPQMPNGKIGASGPNALPPVARDQKSGLALVVNQLLEGTSSALEITQSLKIARHQSVQVVPTDAVEAQDSWVSNQSLESARPS